MDKKAVIFDFDGVIGITMQDNFRAWRDAFRSYGVELIEEDYYLLEGMGRHPIARFFLEKYGLDPNLERTLAETKENNYKVKNSFEIYPEIPAIFSMLKEKGIPMAMVTGASRERINHSLGEEFIGRFSAVVTSDDVTKGKPDPEPYLTAMNKLAVPAPACLVIENARLGIRSAKAAGCTCYALETTLAAGHLLEADEVFPSHNELLERLRTVFDQDF